MTVRRLFTFFSLAHHNTTEVKLFNDPEAVLSTHFALDTTPSGRQEPTKLKEEEIHDGGALIYISRVIFDYRLIMLLQKPCCLLTLKW